MVAPTSLDKIKIRQFNIGTDIHLLLDFPTFADDSLLKFLLSEKMYCKQRTP